MSRSIRYTVIIAAIFSVIMAVSQYLYLKHADEHANDMAITSARSIFSLNLAYRKWNAGHGGVYVAVTEKSGPNPYLKHPKRDLTATDGTLLTLVNPAMMTRQVYEQLQSSSQPIITKVTSLKYVNPANKPDEWETETLNSFEKGVQEASGIINVNGMPYMRLLKPFITEEGCLKCHAWQGYKTGDIRGGLSVGIPMSPFIELVAAEKRSSIVLHLFIWSGGIAGLIFFGRRLRRSEEKIEESEWKFRTLAETAQDWEYWIDETGNVLFVSPYCLSVTGYTPEEFIADPKLIVDLIHPEDKEIYLDHLTHFRDSIHDELTFRITARDGSTKWISHICAPIYSGDRFMGRRVVNLDITEKRSLEEQLLQSQKMEALGLLAGGVAHDFNNILSVIIGYSSLLQGLSGDIRAENARKYLGTINEAADKASGITRNLLTFSRKQEIKPCVTEMSDIIKSLMPLLKIVLGDDIDMRVTYSSQRTRVYADPNQMQQVIMNLAANARDAMNGTGVFSIETGSALVDSAHARVHEVAPGDYVVISVSDTGSGISSEVLPHIFEPFFTTKEKGKGTGLGLSIVYGIIRQQKGFVKVYSEKNIGTTFRIYLPYSESGATETATPEEMSPEDLRGSETLLIAEDDTMMRAFLKDALGDYGYRCIFAADGDEAVKLFEANRADIDLLLLDVILPKMDGVAVFRNIRGSAPEVKAIFMSGYSSEVLAARGLYEDGFDYITKPVIVRELLHKVRSAVRRT